MMQKKYIEVRCSFPENEGELLDLITALMLGLGFEGFYEEEGTLVAYIPESRFSADLIALLDSHSPGRIKFEYRILEPKNWNEEWEKNFQPVVIAGRCLVRAPFHPPQHKYPLEIIIEPKMAFGTGHHPTTGMIAAYLLETGLEGKYLFDMGCGSGILGILAAKAGAARVEMADNDLNAVANARDNILLNDAGPIEVYHGGEETLKNKTPDMITANISKPVLISQMATYANSLNAGGVLVVSGIIEDDREDLLACGLGHGFILSMSVREKDWLMLVFKKQDG